LPRARESKERDESLVWDFHSRTYIHPRMR
jgi:hypothetical protein